MQTIGGYTIIEELGRGGMGVVHRAREPSSGREVALKVLPARADERAQRRFTREVTALARVRHPNVVGVHAAGIDPSGAAWVALELVPGQSLEHLVARRGRLPAQQAARCVAQAARGLAAVHALGIVHRDVKPDNILWADDRVRVTDFGLVRELDADLDATRLSRTGVFLGTPAYWPPEQARGDHAAVDPRTDVYGLGGTLFFLLTGEAPQQGPNLAACLEHLERPPRRPTALCPDVPAELDAVVVRCLSRDPAGRYPSAAALADHLERFAAGVPLANPPRRRGAVLVAAALGLTGALALAARGLPSREALPPAPAAAASPASGSEEPPPPPTASPAEELQLATRALRERPGLDRFRTFTEALAAAYDPARRPWSLAQQWVDALPGEDPFVLAARRRLLALGDPVADDDAWRDLTGDPFGDRAPPCERPVWLESAETWVKLLRSLERAEPSPGRRMALCFLQERALELLWVYCGHWASGSPGIERATVARGLRLIALAPDTPPARRMRLLFEACPLGRGTGAGRFEPWPQLDADPLLGLLCCGVNLAFGLAEIDDLRRAWVRHRDGQGPQTQTNLREEQASRRIVATLALLARNLSVWLYLRACRAGDLLPRADGDAAQRLLDLIEAELSASPATRPDLDALLAGARVGCALLTDTPAPPALRDHPWLTAERLWIAGDAQGAQRALAEQPGLSGLGRHLADSGELPPLSDDAPPAAFDSRAAFPWHADPWLEEVLAGRRWWPGD